MWEAEAANKRNSFLLFLIFFVFVFALGWVFSEVSGLGAFGLVLAGLIALGGTAGSYYWSDKIILAMSQAKPVDPKQNPYLYNVIEGLAIAAGIPKPRAYLIEDTAPNAFATGRDAEHAVIVVTTGLLQKLNRVELEGVLAHEMSHIKNLDIRFMMFVAVMVGVVALLSDWMLRGLFRGRRGGNREMNRGALLLLVVGIVFAILAPLFATLIKLAISRQREFLADASGALLTRYPEGLAAALEKISKDKEPLEAANRATAHLYIVNPFKDLGGLTAGLLSTHPPIEERINRLRARLT